MQNALPDFLLAPPSIMTKAVACLPAFSSLASAACASPEIVSNAPRQSAIVTKRDMGGNLPEKYNGWNGCRVDHLNW